MEPSRDSKPSEPVANKAAVVEAHQRKRWQAQCPIPERYKAATFATFVKDKQPLAFAVMSAFDLTARKSLILTSPKAYGVGKTHLVYALVHRLLAETPAIKTMRHIVVDSLTQERVIVDQVVRLRCPVRVLTETELMARIRATFDSERSETEEEVFTDYKTCDLLIIDDVGKVKPRDVSFLQSVYYRILDWRYANTLPMIMTTNLDLQHLEAHIGGACADRLIQMCGKNVVVMSGKSYREE